MTLPSAITWKTPEQALGGIPLGLRLLVEDKLLYFTWMLEIYLLYLNHMYRLHVTWPSCLTVWPSSSSKKMQTRSRPRKLWVCTAKMENMSTLMSLASVLDRYVYIETY